MVVLMALPKVLMTVDEKVQGKVYYLAGRKVAATVVVLVFHLVA